MNHTGNCAFLPVSIMWTSSNSRAIHRLPEFYSRYQDSRKAAACKQLILGNISNYSKN